MADNKNEKSNTQEKNSSLDIKVNNESVHNESINVNKNIGSFDNDFDPTKDPISQIDNEIVIEQSSNKLGSIREEDKKVDFERFKKTKKRHVFKPAKNAFSIKVDTWLRNDHTMHIIWGIIGAIIGVILAIAISFLATVCIKQSAPTKGMWNLESFRAVALANNVFAGLAIGFVILPLFYLLVTVMVGINGVYRSRQFHFFLWVCLILALLFAIITIPLGSYVIVLDGKFTPFPTAASLFI